MITKERKAEIVKQFGSGPNDTGKPEVQIALLTEHIADLSKHCEANKKRSPQQTWPDYACK